MRQLHRPDVVAGALALCPWTWTNLSWLTTAAKRVKTALRDSDIVARVGRDELRLQLQPRFRASVSTIIGVEAVVHWQHPIHGLFQ